MSVFSFCADGCCQGVSSASIRVISYNKEPGETRESGMVQRAEVHRHQEIGIETESLRCH